MMVWRNGQMEVHMDFDAFVRDIRENQWKVFGVEVYENGKLTAEYGDTVSSRFPIYSATKAIISIAVGIASDQGKFDIDKTVLAYLPAEAKRTKSSLSGNHDTKVTDYVGGRVPVQTGRGELFKLCAFLPHKECIVKSF